MAEHVIVKSRTGRYYLTTAFGQIVVRPARPSDIRWIVDMSAQADTWMASRGVTPEVPPQPLADILAERVARGGMFVAMHGTQRCGTITIDWQDESVWPGQSGDAGYVHGLVVLRQFTGLGIKLLDFAEAIIAEAGRKFIRLDCSAFNPGLRTYYERAGFQRRGTVTLPHRTASRYEKEVRGWTVST